MEIVEQFSKLKIHAKDDRAIYHGPNCRYGIVLEYPEILKMFERNKKSLASYLVITPRRRVSTVNDFHSPYSQQTLIYKYCCPREHCAIDLFYDTSNVVTRYSLSLIQMYIGNSTPRHGLRRYHRLKYTSQ